MYYIEFPDEKDLLRYKLSLGNSYIKFNESTCELPAINEIKVYLVNTATKTRTLYGLEDLVDKFGVNKVFANIKIINLQVIDYDMYNSGASFDMLVSVYKLGTATELLSSFISGIPYFKGTDFEGIDKDTQLQLGLDTYVSYINRIWYSCRKCEFNRMSSLFKPLALSTSGKGLMLFNATDIPAYLPESRVEYSILIMNGEREFYYNSKVFSSLSDFLSSDFLKTKLDMLNRL